MSKFLSSSSLVHRLAQGLHFNSGGKQEQAFRNEVECMDQEFSLRRRNEKYLVLRNETFNQLADKEQTSLAIDLISAKSGLARGDVDAGVQCAFKLAGNKIAVRFVSTQWRNRVASRSKMFSRSSSLPQPDMHECAVYFREPTFIDDMLTPLQIKLRGYLWPLFGKLKVEGQKPSWRYHQLFYVPLSTQSTGGSAMLHPANMHVPHHPSPAGATMAPKSAPTTTIHVPAPTVVPNTRPPSPKSARSPSTAPSTSNHLPARDTIPPPELPDPVRESCISVSRAQLLLPLSVEWATKQEPGMLERLLRACGDNLHVRFGENQVLQVPLSAISLKMSAATAARLGLPASAPT